MLRKTHACKRYAYCSVRFLADLISSAGASVFNLPSRWDLMLGA